MASKKEMGELLNLYSQRVENYKTLLWNYRRLLRTKDKELEFWFFMSMCLLSILVIAGILALVGN